MWKYAKHNRLQIILAASTLALWTGLMALISEDRMAWIIAVSLQQPVVRLLRHAVILIRLCSETEYFVGWYQHWLAAAACPHQLWSDPTDQRHWSSPRLLRLVP